MDNHKNKTRTNWEFLIGKSREKYLDQKITQSVEFEKKKDDETEMNWEKIYIWRSQFYWRLLKAANMDQDV